MISSRKVLVFLFLLTKVFGAIVEIEDGRIEGNVWTSRLGESFHAFLRIPFAEPPIGELRFQDPQPNKKWEGVFNGTFYGPMCVQPILRLDLGISEDCLQLNVFTRNLTGLSPVIVFIHGGAFVGGSGIDQGGPHNLMDKDVVLVTINYRLGPLGFLATGTLDAPGNAGLKDQVLALKWVQKNIQNFGGNPNKTTVTGMSAGGFSSTAFMASPMAKGLFHGVIAMSGSTTFQQPLKTELISLTEKLSKQLNCTTATIKAMIDCLKSKDPQTMADIDLKDYPQCEVVSWMPVVEPDLGQERFFEEDPNKSFADGNFEKVPMMIGRTSDEFIDIVPRLLDSDLLKDLNENFNDIAPHCFYYEKGTSKSAEISKAIRNTYLPFDEIDVRSFGALNNLFADAYVGYAINRLVHFMSNHTDVYYYKFSYVGRFSVFRYPQNQPYGVHHFDDLQYIFAIDFMSPLIRDTDPEDFMIRRMTSIWESFAHSGNPNYDSDPNVINWPKHNSTHEFYMDIGLHLIEKNGMLLERYSMWDKVLQSSANNFKMEKFLVFLIFVQIVKHLL